MFNDDVGFEKIFIATGYTDLRRGIDGLASTIKFQFDLDPFQKGFKNNSSQEPPITAVLNFSMYSLLSVYRSEASVTRFLFTPKTHCCIMRKMQKKTLHMRQTKTIYHWKGLLSRRRWEK